MSLLTNATVWSPWFSQSLHLRRRQDRSPASTHQQWFGNIWFFLFTHFIFFFPSSLLLREAAVRPAGRGGGSGASGARESAWVTEGVSGGGIDGRPREPGVRAAPAGFFLLLRRRGVLGTSDVVVVAAGRTDVVGARSGS